VAELLSLKATSQITGDIITNRLAIEPGCRFSGNCKMTDEKITYAEKTEGPEED